MNESQHLYFAVMAENRLNTATSRIQILAVPLKTESIFTFRVFDYTLMYGWVVCILTIPTSAARLPACISYIRISFMLEQLVCQLILPTLS
jgi:hypothetical protein